MSTAASTESQIESTPTPAPDPFPGLTGAEQRILGLIVKGYNNREIATQLEISGKTYDTHRGHILQKLGLKGCGTAAEVRLAHAALRAGFIKLEECLPTPEGTYGWQQQP